MEPVIEYYQNGSPRYIPDLVICEGNTIEAIIEVKFSPNWYPRITQDLKKLSLQSSKERIDRRYFGKRIPDTGLWEEPSLSITPLTKFLIAVIGKFDSSAVDFKTIKEHIKDNDLLKRYYHMSGKVHGANIEIEYNNVCKMRW